MWPDHHFLRFPAGPALTGITPYFWLLVVCVCLGSIGSSMFHPTVAGMVEPYAGRHFGLARSIFGTGGLLTPLTGKLADIFTIQPVLTAIAIIPVLTVVPIVFLFSKDPSAVSA